MQKLQSVVEYGCCMQNFKGMFSHPRTDASLTSKEIGQQELHCLGTFHPSTAVKQKLSLKDSKEVRKLLSNRPVFKREHFGPWYSTDKKLVFSQPLSVPGFPLLWVFWYWLKYRQTWKIKGICREI